jgi:hypothetical protein
MSFSVVTRFDIKRSLKDIDIVAVGSGIELALKFSNYFQNNQRIQVFKPTVPPCFVLKIGGH